MVTLNRIGSDVNKGLLPSVLPLFENGRISWAMRYHRRSSWRQRFAQVTAGRNWWAIRYHRSSDGGNAQKYRFRCQQRLATACTSIIRWSGIGWIWRRCHGRISWAMWYHRRSPWRRRFASVTADIGRCWWRLSELFSLRGHRGCQGWVGRVGWMGRVGRMGRVLILDQAQLLFATFFGSLQMTFLFFFRPISSNLEQKADI